MKLIKLYCNKPNIFPDLTFLDGVNVVYARITNTKNDKKDSHNLGKTFLITVIDFALLKTADKSGRSKHPLRSHPDLFEDFVFYLHVQNPQGKHIAIRREVEGRLTICLYESDEPPGDLRDLEKSDWTYPSLGLKNAKSTLNDLLELRMLPLSYRKGLGYCLRQQGDYEDIFRLPSKFGQGSDFEWKSYLLISLGLDAESYKLKQDLEKELKAYKEAHKILSESTQVEDDEYDKIRARIEQKEQILDQQEIELNNFDFHQIEGEINKDVVTRIGGDIKRLNQERFMLSRELDDIKASLTSEFELDMSKIRMVFEEAKLYFPEKMLADYEQLSEFNKKLTVGRTKRLRELEGKLSEQLEYVELQLLRLHVEQKNSLRILQNKAAFGKFKLLQRNHIKSFQALEMLRGELESLNKVALLGEEITTKKTQIIKAKKDIEKIIRVAGDVPRYKKVRLLFSQYVYEVLDTEAVLFIKVNSAGNPELEITMFDQELPEHETSEHGGTSYKKVLCACYDLAMLSACAEESFFHFVYHDGILEGLDDRKKIKLLKLIRNVCTEYQIQYILTVIDSDLPRGPLDHKVKFAPDEILRELHDDGDEGRLFRCRKF